MLSSITGTGEHMDLNDIPGQAASHKKMPGLRRVIGSLLATVATLALPLVAAHAAPPGALDQAQALKVGDDAYVYGVTLLEFERAWRLDTSVTVPNEWGNAPVNQVGNQRILSTPANQDKEIVGPSNSTLYSNAHLDLSRGPIVLHVPNVRKHRYYAWEFLDPYTNVFAYVGTRATGDRAGNYAIVGPSWHGKLPRRIRRMKLRRINSAYNHVWLFGRTLVYGGGDLRNATRIQDGFKVIPLKAFKRVGLRYRPRRPKTIVTNPTIPTLPTGIAFYDALGDALAQNPPPAQDRPIVQEMATAGIGPGLHPSTENLPAPTISGLQAAAAAGPTHVRYLEFQMVFATAELNDGWYVPDRDLGNWGTNYNERAAWAVYGICANRNEEAMYPSGVFDNGHLPLNGSEKYLLHFAPGQTPPAKYFWSLTIYDINSQLVPNPYNKYSVGSYSPLQYNKDGSLDIYVQPTPPAGRESNWLPSPANTTFVVPLRVYGPKQAVLDRTYHYPTIEHVL